ncbi:MAG: hypothetical protein U0163_12590 [Gemmatimonadaceae bacterium]
MPRRSLLSLSLVPMLAIGASLSAQTFHVAKRVSLPGDEGWDYLTADAAAHRLYVTHASRVLVVDTQSDSLVGEIPKTPGVHGVALAPDLNRGFVSNGRDTSVTVFELGSLATVATVKVTGRNPDAIAYDAATKRVFTFNGGGANATAIDATTNQVVGTIPLGGKPEFPQTDGMGKLFVNIEDTGEIAVVDTKAMSVVSRWKLTGCEEPTGLQLDRARHRLFSVCGGSKVMVVLNSETGAIVATLPIGAGCDGVAYDAERQLAVSSNGEGTMTVVHHDGSDHYSVVQTVTTQRSARTITIDPSTHRFYTVAAQYGTAPAATADNPRPRPPMVPGSFTLLIVER